MDEKIKNEYWGDFGERFVTETYRDVKNGNFGYVYSETNLGEVERVLKEKGVKYSIKKETDFWLITPDTLREDGRKRNGQWRNKEKKQTD